MFKKALFALTLIFLLTGTVNAGPLREFSGPTYITQLTKYLNNISRNWSNLPIGKIILTHILTNVNAHPPTVLFQNEKEDIMLTITKSSTSVYLGHERCTTFIVRISSKNGLQDTMFSTFFCFNTIDKSASLKISNIDYNPASK